MSNVTAAIDNAIICMIGAADALAALNTAQTNATDSFRMSAENTLRAIESGASAVAIADAAKAAIADGRAKAKTLYTSDPAVGFHALTGLALRLPGELGQIKTYAGYVDVLPSDVQTAIKNIGQRKARPIIAGAETLPDAYASMIDAAKVAKVAKAKVETDESDESAETTEPATTVAQLLASAQSILTGAVKRDDWTADDYAAAQTLINMIGSKKVVSAVA